MLENLAKQLQTVINLVFEKEGDFIKSLCPQYSEYELLEFYMASERSRMTLLSFDGAHFTDTVKTQEVIDWFEANNK